MLALLTTCPAWCQADTVAVKRKVKVLAIPGVFSSHETSLGFGLVGLATFRLKNESDTTQASQINIGAAYTLLDQYLLFIPFQLFWKEEKYKLYGELGYYKFYFLFHGIGSDHLGENEEAFDVLFPRVRINFLKRLGDRTFIGGRYAMDDFNITRTDSTGSLRDPSLVGSCGGRISGLGPVLNLDTRDNIFQPYRGVIAEFSFLVYNATIASRYNFSQASLEVSKYIPLRKITTDPNKRSIQPILGLNLLTVVADGQVPFNALGVLGGTKRMRGYYEGYYRDKRMIEGQAEFRIPLFNKTSGFLQRFGIVGFGGLGTVAPEFSKLAIDQVVYTYGGGLRMQLDRKQGINLRVDYGRSANTSGFYLSIGEAF